MILKGNQRGGGKQMALHLLNGEKNDHIHVHRIEGFVADDVLGALNEAYALSKGTQCKQFMYSLSLSPPANEDMPISVYEEALKRVEKKLDLVGQPHVVVFHEKKGRRHAHCVWSRIDTEKMKAINISHPKLKLNTIAKSLYIEHGWQMPEGFRDKNRKNPLNYTRAEWQQAARTGQSPKAIKATLQECWVVSDDRKEFEAALQECGYYLAKGDRRGYVAVDIHGEIYSLTRQLRAKKKDLETRLGKADALPSVHTVKEKISGQLLEIFKNFLDEQKKEHKKELHPLLTKKQKMTHQHQKDRTAQKTYQGNRWQSEELKRSAKIRQGFKGIWDKLNGKYQKTRKQNKQETQHCHTRDQKERETLITTQLSMRQNLQMQTNHENSRQHLIRDLSHMADMNKHQTNPSCKHEHSISLDHQTDHSINSPDIDLESDV